MRQLIIFLLLIGSLTNNAVAKELQIDFISQKDVLLRYRHISIYAGSFPLPNKLKKPDILLLFKSDTPVKDLHDFFLFAPKSNLPQDTEKQIGLRCGESYLYRNKDIHVAIDGFSDCNLKNHNNITKGLTGYILTFADQTGNIEKIYLTKESHIPSFVMQKLKEMEDSITIISQKLRGWPR